MPLFDLRETRNLRLYQNARKARWVFLGTLVVVAGSTIWALASNVSSGVWTTADLALLPFAALFNGIADGKRISALGQLGLSLNVSNLYVQGLNTGQGYAAELRLYDGNGTSGTLDLTNFSAPVGLKNGAARLAGYQVLLPVDQTSQFETLQVQVVANESNTSTLTPIAFNYSTSTKKVYFEANLTYDMIAGLPLTESYSATHSEVNPNGSLAFVLQAVRTGGKESTYLWLPTSNGTTNGLPLGLERYTGEQAFDLVLINASGNIKSDAIPYPGGGSYQVALGTGLNNLLFPREQFLSSPFGQAILQGRSSYSATNTTMPPILSDNASARSLLTQPFGTGWGLMYELGAYWQNRSIAPSSGGGNFSSVSEKGTLSNSSLQVRVLSVASAITNNTGGLASDPALYQGVTAPPAIDAILTLNVSSTPTLDVLLAGLLDNTTGGVNGTFQTVTNQVPSLGLNPAVVNALANATIVGQGLYKAPPDNYVPPPPPKNSGIWGLFVNAVSAVVQTIRGAIVSLVATVWTATVAAFTYFNHLAHEAAAVGGSLLARIAAELVGVGKSILNAFEQLVSYVVKLVTQLINASLSGFYAVRSSFGQAVNNSLNYAKSTLVDGNITEAAAAGIWQVLSGSVFVISLGITVVAEVAVGLLAVFTAGASDLTGIVIALVLGFLLSVVLPSLSNFVTPRTAFTAETLANKTSNQGPNQPDWNVAACAFGWSDTGFTSVIGVQELKEALETKTSFGETVNTAVALALSLVAAALAFVSVTIKSLILSVLAISLAFGSVVPDLVGLAGGGLFGWETKDVDYIVLGMDAFVAGYGIYQAVDYGI